MTKANENLTWRFFSLAAFWAATDLCELSMSCTFDIAWCQWISIKTKAQVSLITGCAFQCKIFCDEKKNKIREAINNITTALQLSLVIWFEMHQFHLKLISISLTREENGSRNEFMNWKQKSLKQKDILSDWTLFSALCGL